MMKKLIYAILFLLTTGIGLAQTPKIAFEQYGVAEGLPEEATFVGFQDNKGFIWFGTQNGLVKYDGYKFKVYQAVSNNKDSTDLQLKSAYGGLLKAKDGKIWLSGYTLLGGLASFDPVNENFRNYFVGKNNLNNNEISVCHILVEDREGNIWFWYRPGSALGLLGTLCRLNPKTGEIKKFIVKSDLNNYRSKLVIDSTNNIWLLDHKKNLNKLNRQKDSFEIVIPAGKPLSMSGQTDTISLLKNGMGNRLLLLGVHGLYVYDTKAQKVFKSYVKSKGLINGLAADSIVNAIKDSRGQYWVTHNGGMISLIDPVTENIQTFTYGMGPLAFNQGPKTLKFFRIRLQTKNGIWFQAGYGNLVFGFFMYYDFSNKTFQFYDNKFNISNNPLKNYDQDGQGYSFMEDRTGLLWVFTRPGFYKQAPKKHQMDLFRYNFEEQNGLPSDSIRYLYEDRKKRLWIGTSNGLAIYQPGQENFKVFRNISTNTASLSNNRITMVQEDADGKIWVGTENGLNQWQENTNSFKRFFYTANEVNSCRFIFPDKQNRLWLSIANKGVFVLDKNTGKTIKSYLPNDKNPLALSSKWISTFYQDSKGMIWLGDLNNNTNIFGLYRLNQTEDGFIHYLPISGDNNSISSVKISFLTEDEQKRLWIGTSEGLNLYDHEHDRFTRYIFPATFTGFAKNKNGQLFFSSVRNNGLVTVDPTSGKTEYYGEEKGLLHMDLKGNEWREITRDDLGMFWLPNERGLSVFDPENKSFTNYLEKDGFQTSGTLRNAYTTLKTSNGDIWIGGSKGLNHIVPTNLLKKDSSLPSIVITQVSINDSVYSKPDGTIFKKSVAYTDDFKLAYWQKDIKFDFVALHYLRSEDNQYSWKLENYDKDWTAPSKERKASYTNLSPGTYIFRIKASNADNVWNEEGISITIHILPPWWKTWWAYLIYTLLFLGALRVFSKWRERKLQNENDILEARVEERTNSLHATLENLKSTQSQLVQSEKMASLGELTAGIAHEIQNPLNFVNNFSEVSTELVDEMNEEIEKGNLEDVKLIGSDLKQNLEKINHHGKRAGEIVKGMLQHSRSSSGQKEPTDINALCDEYLRLAYHGLRAKDNSFNSSFETQFDVTIGMISIQPQEMGRVILNLINNAFYAVGERKKNSPESYDPKVTVSTEKENGNILISIKDNGTGIPQKVVDKIFQPFFTTKPTGQGTGLGLSLSYDIVKAHGGGLKVETTEGEGTIFKIILPA